MDVKCAPEAQPPRQQRCGPQGLRRLLQSEASARHASRRLLKEHRQSIPDGTVHRRQSFSLVDCVVALVSYALMVSEVLRTGFGIRSLHQYHTLEPDTYIYFGPYAYVAHHFSTQNATRDAVALWPYKYDTTSVTMRALADHLKLETWSPCVLYKATCDEETHLTRKDVFDMIETLIDGVARHQGRDPSRRRGALTLRSAVEYKDRVYHYVMPWFFNRVVKRTSQATHYSYNRSRSPSTRSLCGGFKSTSCPYSCGQSWTNLKRVECSLPGRCPYEAPRVWDLIARREEQLAAFYPGHTVDFIVLDGAEDFMRSGIANQGRKYYEVVVLTRVRKCDNDGSCRIMAVDDFRYEAATFIINAPSWLSVVATLRGASQLYAWARLCLLIVGSYRAHHSEQQLRTRLALTARTFFLVPSQVVVYGSSFSVTLYMLAHLIDSAAEYEVVYAYFMSTLGQIHWTLGGIVRHCAVSMRCVWIISFWRHCIVTSSMRRSWSPIHGIPSSTEFSITLIASVTVFAQVRSISLRRTKVLESYEVVHSAVRYPLLTSLTDATHTTVNNLVGGTTVDIQSVLSGVMGLFTIALFFWATHKVAPRFMPLTLALSSTTIAPYAAGMLWPPNRLVVSWYGNMIQFRSSTMKTSPVPTQQPDPEFKAAEERMPTRTRYDALESFRRLYRTSKFAASLPDRSLAMRRSTSSRCVQRNMHCVGIRTPEIESTVVLMNLATMTDPFTYFDLHWSRRRLVSLYVSRRTKRSSLLPFGLEASSADIPIDWDDMELVAVVNSTDLEWQDLLRCG